MISQTQRVRAHDNKLKALEMRKSRASYREIGVALGISGAAAWKLVHHALDETLHDRPTEALQIELESLDRLESRLWPLAGDPAYIDRILKIKRLRAELLGLYAPTVQEISGPSGGAVQVEHVFDYGTVEANLARHVLPNDKESA